MVQRGASLNKVMNFGFHNRRTFFDWLRDYQILEQDFPLQLIKICLRASLIYTAVCAIKLRLRLMPTPRAIRVNSTRLFIISALTELGCHNKRLYPCILCHSSATQVQYGLYQYGTIPRLRFPILQISVESQICRFARHEHVCCSGGIAPMTPLTSALDGDARSASCPGRWVGLRTSPDASKEM